MALNFTFTSICMFIYNLQCENGTINTDGSGLLDVRFGENKECADIFEQCCEVEKIKEKDVGSGNFGVNVQNTTDNSKGNPKRCGVRNEKGLLFGITGAFQGESEYGKNEN